MALNVFRAGACLRCLVLRLDTCIGGTRERAVHANDDTEWQPVLPQHCVHY